MALTDQLSYVWWIDRDAIAISKKSDTSSLDDKYTGPPAGKEVTLFITKYDEVFISATTGEGIGIDEEPNIPTEFHRALVDRAIQQGYEMSIGSNPVAVQAIQLFEGKWEKAIKGGRKYAKTNRTGSASYAVRPVAF